MDPAAEYQRQVRVENARLRLAESRWLWRRRWVLWARLVLIAWAVAVAVTHVL